MPRPGACPVPPARRKETYVTIAHAALAAAPLHGLAVNPLSPVSLLRAFGTLGLFVILFAETGLLIGFFLPGDTLLFTAGLLTATSAASRLHLPLGWVLAAAAGGALCGAQAGYLLGRRGGRAVLSRSRGPRLRAAAANSRLLLARYGPGKAIVLARFIPVLRTVVNPMAGILEVPAATFTFWQVTGGLAWTLGVTIAGHALGASTPGIDSYLLPAVAVIGALSAIPLAVELARGRRHRAGSRHAGRHLAAVPGGTGDESRKTEAGAR